MTAARGMLGALGALASVALALPVLVLLGASSGPAAAEAPSLVDAEIPAEYLALYQSAARAHGLDWAVLAAIGAIESDHGRSEAAGVRSGVNFAGCCAGPMQFDVTPESGSTWEAYGLDGNGDGRRDPYDPADAIPAAAAYLAAHGAPGDYRRALLAYNRSEAYVANVLGRAEEYRRTATAGTALGSAGAAGFVYPVQDAEGRPTGSFSDDYRSHRGAGGHCPTQPTWHCATDVFAPRGTLLVAPIAGRVTRLGASGLGGNRLWIEGRVERFYLAHLDAFAPGLAEGASVSAGEPVGAVGDTGSARGTSPHLHLAWERLSTGVWSNSNPHALLLASTGRVGRG